MTWPRSVGNITHDSRLLRQDGSEQKGNVLNSFLPVTSLPGEDVDCDSPPGFEIITLLSVREIPFHFKQFFWFCFCCCFLLLCVKGQRILAFLVFLSLWLISLFCLNLEADDCRFLPVSQYSLAFTLRMLRLYPPPTQRQASSPMTCSLPAIAKRNACEHRLRFVNELQCLPTVSLFGSVQAARGLQRRHR